MMKDYLYGDLLKPDEGYSTDFALGMTYSMGFEALLTAFLSFGMLGDVDDSIRQSPHVLLDAITRNSDKVVIFCNKGGIGVPPEVIKVYTLMEKNVFEVFNPDDFKANFHPKLWLIREVNTIDPDDKKLKLIISSRNMAYSDTLDCIVCLRGKIVEDSNTSKNDKLIQFIEKICAYSNIETAQNELVKSLIADLSKVPHFDVEDPFEDYEFFPYLFKEDFGLGSFEQYLSGYESLIVSPFIDYHFINEISKKTKYKRSLVTRKEYVSRPIYDLINEKGNVYISLDDLASNGMDLHAKMYYVYDGMEKMYLYLGSANATTTAFTRNGEFLLRLKYKKGHSRYDKFLKEFYDENSKECKFIKMNEPVVETSSLGYDDAELSIKQLVCDNSLEANIIAHRDGTYSVIITSPNNAFTIPVQISPLQRRDKMKVWNGNVKFDNLSAEDLSEFYIVSADFENEGTIRHHESIVRIKTSGMPKDRDLMIYKSIIKKEEDFLKYLRFMLAENPAQQIALDYLEQKQRESKGANNADAIAFSGLYENMLRVAAINPKQILEIGRLMKKLDPKVVPASFEKIYKQFVAALKN